MPPLSPKARIPTHPIASLHFPSAQPVDTQLREEDARISEKTRDCERKGRTLAKLEKKLRAQEAAQRKERETEVETIPCSRSNKAESTVMRTVQSMVSSK